MDLQVRKLNLISYLINLQDEKIFSKIESAIYENKKNKSKKVKPFTSKQLIDRSNLSEIDYKSGKYKTQEQLEKESENW